jgi:phage gp46-like protein
MKDILLNSDNGYLDFSIENGDFKMTGGFETAIIMSILCEARALASEVPTAELRRGWWGNLVGDFANYEIGSKIWLLYQSKRTPDTLALIKTYAINALQWMINDGYIDKIDADSSFIEDGIFLIIKLYRSQNLVDSVGFKIWEQTNLINITTA